MNVVHWKWYFFIAKLYQIMFMYLKDLICAFKDYVHFSSLVIINNVVKLLQISLKIVHCKWQFHFIKSYVQLYVMKNIFLVHHMVL
jgi:hypothetical protein